MEAGKEFFAEEGFKIVTGYRYLGGFVGESQKQTLFIQDRIKNWIAGVDDLARAAVKYPQTAYAGLQKSLQQEIFISFDPNYRSLLFQNDKQSFIDQSWNFLDSCHFFKVSDEEAMMLTGRQTVTDAAADFLERSKASNLCGMLGEP